MKDKDNQPVLASMFKNFFVVFLLGLLVLPTSASAASYRGEVSAWLPYWSDKAGLKVATEHLRDLDTVYPFVYEIDATGKIVSKTDLNSREWRNFFRDAKKKRVDVIPTIAWFDGDAIHTTLSDRTQRRKLVAEIEDLVDDNNYKGINIDFEQKKPETIDYFSDFLRELDRALGSDELTCAIEARTPPEDLYTTVPKPLRYANDYEAINRYCDRVELMTYDQQRADLTLNKKREGLPYAPVADNDWVEKVVKLALKDIDADKIYLGIPTYGRAYDVKVAPEWYRDYTRVAAVNPPRIQELIEKYDLEVGQTAGGESFISYFPEDSVYKIFNQLPVPNNTPKGYEAAAKALLVANLAKVELPVRILTWNNAAAIESKLKLAKDYDLAGVAIFSLNGEEDNQMWKLF